MKKTCINPNESSKMILELLQSDKPCMISRFGSVEMGAVMNVRQMTLAGRIKSLLTTGHISGITEETRDMLTNNAGFFPSDNYNIKQFVKVLLDAAGEIDILGSWLPDEEKLGDVMNPERVHLIFLEPYWADKPWMKALEGKKVLVVHPFSTTIRKQYAIRELLFENKDVLPEFKSLQVMPAVQSIGGRPYITDEKTGLLVRADFTTWFEALSYMESEVEKYDFDVALIGCGAYGMPLAAHIKRMGKKAVHIGGALQLFFGIKGKRWENAEYAKTMRNSWPRVNYLRLLDNPHWVHPSKAETPKAAENVENGCYW